MLNIIIKDDCAKVEKVMDNIISIINKVGFLSTNSILMILSRDTKHKSLYAETPINKLDQWNSFGYVANNIKNYSLCRTNMGTLLELSDPVLGRPLEEECCYEDSKKEKNNMTKKTSGKYKMTESFDPVHKPSHYTEGRKYEPRKVIHDWELNFNLGNAVKYIARAGRKGSKVEDLQKAIQYIEFEIEEILNNQEEKNDEENNKENE